MKTFSWLVIFGLRRPSGPQKDSASLILDFRGKKKLCPRDALLSLSLPFTPSLRFSLVRPLAVKAAARVAENNDIIAGSLAAYGN